MNFLVISVFLGILALLITLENLLVCFLVFGYKTLRTYTNGFVVSLAIADLLYGSVILPMYIFKGPVLILSYLITMVLLANIATLLSVTFDRYLAVLHPLVYQIFMQKHFLKIVAVSWLVPMLISLIPLTYSSDFTMKEHKGFVYFIVIFGVVIPYLLILCAYVRVFQRVAQHVKYLAVESNANDEQAKQEGKRATAEAYVARIFVIIAVVFIVSWMPIVYMTVVNNIGRHDLIPWQLAIASWFTLSLSAMINAPLYAFIKKDFNTVLKRLLCNSQSFEEQVEEEEPEGLFTVVENGAV